MPTETEKRAIWADWQNDRIVAEYFELDRTQRAGGKVVKTDLYERLGALVDRSPGSIESKFQNISAVLASLEMTYAQGLKPRANIQQALADAVERYLDGHPALVFGNPEAPQADPLDVLEVAPPMAGPPKLKVESTVERIARKYNYAERDARNRKLGALGERLVLAREKQKLEIAGKERLASLVRHVSEVDGDGVGYDILSFEPTGEKRLIEVKTTNGAATTAFFLSRTELEVSLERADEWCLHRVHLFDTTPRVFVLRAPLANAANLQAETWRASF